MTKRNDDIPETDEQWFKQARLRMPNKSNPWHMSDVDVFRVNIEKFAEDSGGLVRVSLVRNDDLGMAVAVRTRQPWAMVLAAAVGEALKSMRARPKGSPAHCIGCERAFDGNAGSPLAFMIWLPGAKDTDLNDGVPVGLAQPVCAECCKKSDAELLDCSTDVMRKIFHNVDVIERDDE